MWDKLFGFLSGGFTSEVGKIIDDATLSKEEKLDKITNLIIVEMKAASEVIITEAKSDNWLAANWRPITMLTFVIIIANNYIVYPYLSLFFHEAPMMEIPPDMWGLLKIGLGGYVVGRSGEKIVKVLKS